MKTPDSQGPASDSEVKKGQPREETEIKIPEGTLLFDPEKRGEGFDVIGVTKILETSLGSADFLNYFPRKDRDTLPEEMFTTRVLFEGMKGLRRIIIEKKNLSAEEINKIIQICFQLEMLNEYYIFAEKMLKDTEELIRSTSQYLGNYNNTVRANPELLKEELASEEGSSSVTPIENQLSDFGIFLAKLKQAIPATAEKINKLIKQLDDLKVLSFEPAPGFNQMWWPVKRLIAKPYPGVDNS